VDEDQGKMGQKTREIIKTKSKKISNGTAVRARFVAKKKRKGKRKKNLGRGHPHFTGRAPDTREKSLRRTKGKTKSALYWGKGAQKEE